MSTLSAHDQAVLTCIFNPHLPVEEAIEEEPKDEEEITEDVLKTRNMELEAVKIAEKGNLEEGLRILAEAIKIAPDRPSLYNNRAHVYQFMRRFEDAFNDLTTAISLCKDNHKKTLSQAYCQRGILHKRNQCTELAKSDFDKAAELGSKFAKTQLIELNPYAALCNQMLRQVMEKLP